jgi:tetratricopeptide (TPR) repeat protein
MPAELAYANPCPKGTIDMKHCGILLAWSAIALAGTGRSQESATTGTNPAECLNLWRQAEAKSNARAVPEAIALWERFTAMNPHVGAAWARLGRAYHDAKNYEKSISAYKRALELRAGYPWASAYDIACCHALLGQEEQALEWLAKSLQMGFRNLEKIRTDDDLKVLRGDERYRKLAAVVDVSTLSRTDGWRFDLDLLAREIKRVHYQPFRKISEADFQAQVNRLRDDIPKLTEDQVRVRFMKLVCLVGDGHTTMEFRHARDKSGRAVPVDFYRFGEGLFITRAHPRFRELAGAQVLDVAGHSIDETFRSLDSVVAKDNSMGLLWQGPIFLRYTWIVRGLGLSSAPSGLTLRVKKLDGTVEQITLPEDAGEPTDAWVRPPLPDGRGLPLYLKRQHFAYWFEYLENPKVVYFQYNRVQNDGKETIAKFSKRLFDFLEQHDVQKLVIDMRWNKGGNNFLNAPILEGLIRSTKINQPGTLFVIVGRQTFSAAMCGVTQMERYTKAIMVGEPTGSSPNFIGETVIVNLPYCKMSASISDLYWENSVAMDYRTWIAPRIYTPPTFAAYQGGRDPALEAILAVTPEMVSHE